VERIRFLALLSLVAVFFSCHLVVLCRSEDAFLTFMKNIKTKVTSLAKQKAVGGKRYKLYFAIPGPIPQCKSVAQRETTYGTKDNFVLGACSSLCYFFLQGLVG